MNHTCFCEMFASPNQQSTFSKVPKKGLPRGQHEQTTDLFVKEGKITQNDQDKFIRQYGII